MDPAASLTLALLALLVEAAIGYPAPVYAAIGHPVTWIGALIGALDRRLNRDGDGFARRRAAGVLALLVLLVTVGVAAFLVQLATGALGRIGTYLVLPLLASSLVAQRSLHDHVARVAEALETEGLPGGRRAVSMIVGRNPEHLDEAGVCRAAIESLAENFSDGVTAPAFWTAVLGLPGGALYKAINTADSMIGHKNPRHLAFGWAAARLDDLVNLPASRLTALSIVIAAATDPALSAREAIRAVRRDARSHKSPNAGWPEAAMAGALGIRLAGPRVYGDTAVFDGWMGDGRAELGPADIRRAVALYRRAAVVQFALLAAALALVLAF